MSTEKKWDFDAVTRQLTENDIVIANDVSPEHGTLMALAPELFEALKCLVVASPNEVDMRRLLEFSGLDDVKELQLKLVIYIDALDQARTLIAKVATE